MLNLSPTEIERLVIFQAAELARRRRGRGLQLNQAETEALLVDEALEAARDGLSIADIRSKVSTILTADDVLPGVESLVHTVIVEGQFRDGTRLITVFDPIGVGASNGEDRVVPGEIVYGIGDIELNEGAVSIEIDVTNTGDRAIHVTSHVHFFEVNRALRMDRSAAFGMRLDVPAGTTIRFEPGMRRGVRLVAIGGFGLVTGHNHLTDGLISDPTVRQRAIERARAAGYEGA